MVQQKANYLNEIVFPLKYILHVLNVRMHFLWNISFSKLQFSPNCFIFISAKEIWERKWLATFVFFKWYKGLIYMEKANRKESRFVYFPIMYLIIFFSICNEDCRRMMSSFRHLLGQSHKTNQKDLHIRCLKSFGFVVNEKSRTMETQWQNVCWKCEQKYSKYILHNLLAQSAN